LGRCALARVTTALVLAQSDTMSGAASGGRRCSRGAVPQSERATPATTRLLSIDISRRPLRTGYRLACSAKTAWSAANRDEQAAQVEFSALWPSRRAISTASTQASLDTS